MGIGRSKLPEMIRSHQSEPEEQPNHVVGAPAAQQQEFSSMVYETRLTGRGMEMSDLKLKLGYHDVIGHVNGTSRVASGTTVRVNAITGVSGIGKTALAQSLLQDQNVGRHFDHHVYWVPVVGNKIDDKKRFASAIIKAVQFPAAVPKYHDWEPLRIHLKDCIKDKKFLLILDDVCDVDNVTWHEELKPCLDAGAPGSRILVTTQDRDLAAKMGSSMLDLEPLSNEDSWLLLCDIAFQRRTEEQIRHFESVGKELLEKGCLGIPFLIKTLGYFLREKRTIQEWENVLESGRWSRNSGEYGLIPPPMLISTSDASTADLRRCFKFCACQPNDSEIDRDVLIKFWMALGFLGRKKGDQMEKKGAECFKILERLSFLQGYERGGIDNQRVTRYQFYRPLHDLAKLQAGSESRCIQNGTSSSLEFPSRKTRHLTLIFGDDNGDNDTGNVPGSLSHAGNLRMLKLVVESGSLEVPSFVFREFPNLRALDLSCTGLTELPPEVSKLKFLKTLILSGSRFPKLPDTLCDLKNLQTLILNGCEELIELPEKIGQLTHLRHLELKDTPSLKKFPEGFGKLTNLRTLSKFVVAAEDLRKGAKIGELKELNLLQGHLEIQGLNRVKRGIDAKEAALPDKKHLQSLCLDFGHNLSQKSNTVEIMEDVLEALKPNQAMETSNVELCNYPESAHRRWMVSHPQMHLALFP